jgi:hypothetical protein
MRIKNIEIEPFIKFLMSFELKGRESRLRTRFAKLLMERLKLINEENMDLIRQFGNKDENGNIKIVERDGKRYYDVVDKDAYNREYFILMNEDFVIDETEERKEMLLFIKELILNCDMTFKDEEALEYDRWCEIVEEINYEDKN